MDGSRDQAPSHADATGRNTPFTSLAASEYDAIARGKSWKRDDEGHAEKSAGFALPGAIKSAKSLVTRRSVSRLTATDDGPCWRTTHSQPPLRTSPRAAPDTQ